MSQSDLTKGGNIPTGINSVLMCGEKRPNLAGLYSTLRHNASRMLTAATVALGLSALTSCGLVRDDLDPCPEDIKTRFELRFIYDYNMEFANAFHNQVDCLSVYFFDGNGELMYIDYITDPELLSDEDWRLYPELPDGDYHVVAYGGMDCDQASFYRTGNFPEGTHFTNLHVQLDPTSLVIPENSRLHNHYYGSLDFTIGGENGVTKATVPMMRNTNNIHIALQNENVSQPIDHNDFIFEITDDNNDFAHDNSLIPTGVITYQPWLKENRSTRPSLSDVTQEQTAWWDQEDVESRADGTDFHAAVGHFTTSRLMDTYNTGKTTPTTLNIHKADGTGTVFSIPLVKYMLMFKNEGAGASTNVMTDQEYLDRENTWNFVFFIKDGFWVQTHLIINDWEVRMNHTDF